MALRLLWLLMLLGATTSEDDGAESRAANLEEDDDEIVHGMVTDAVAYAQRYDWVVPMVLNREVVSDVGYWALRSCTASLINKEWALTAAHCVYENGALIDASSRLLLYGRSCLLGTHVKNEDGEMEERQGSKQCEGPQVPFVKLQITEIRTQGYPYTNKDIALLRYNPVSKAKAHDKLQWQLAALRSNLAEVKELIALDPTDADVLEMHEEILNDITLTIKLIEVNGRSMVDGIIRRGIPQQLPQISIYPVDQGTSVSFFGWGDDVDIYKPKTDGYDPYKSKRSTAQQIRWCADAIIRATAAKQGMSPASLRRPGPSAGLTCPDAYDCIPCKPNGPSRHKCEVEAGRCQCNRLHYLARLEDVAEGAGLSPGTEEQDAARRSCIDRVKDAYIIPSAFLKYARMSTTDCSRLRVTMSPDTTFCAIGPKRWVTMGTGDSGGPCIGSEGKEGLFRFITGGSWPKTPPSLVGINILGRDVDMDSGLPDPHRPVGFTRLSAYMQWINTETGWEHFEYPPQKRVTLEESVGLDELALELEEDLHRLTAA